jgi:hypothetical protein
LGNLGLVFASGGKITSNKNWKTSNFAIGYNRISSLSQNSYWSGNSNHSIMNYMEESANENGLNDFSTQLAFETFGLDTAKGRIISDFTSGNYSSFKTNSTKRTGGVNEVLFNYAANYRDKFSIGFTLGVPLLRFEEDKIYTEEDRTGTVPFFNNLKYNEVLVTEGAGLNLKAGIIYRANQMLRLGLAYHSPTFYNISDQYNSSFQYNLTGSDGKIYDNTAKSPDGQYEYQLLTPSKWIGSASVILGKKGFISADLEYIDHSGSRFSYDGVDKKSEVIVNSDIQKRFKSTINLRVGGEMVVDIFRFRAGLVLHLLKVITD